MRTQVKQRMTKLFINSKFLRIIMRSKYFGLNELDKELEKYLPNEGFFVELGANDGIKQSNTKYFELYKGWQGILVEPHPKNYLKCKQNRKKTTQVWNFACVGMNYPSSEMEFIFSDLMTIGLSGKSEIVDKIGHARSGSTHLEGPDKISNFTAKTITLNKLLEMSRAPTQMQLLSLDCEGAEIEVINGIDHSRFRFDFICIEIRDYAISGQELENQGYQLVTRLSHHDYLFQDSQVNSRWENK